MKEGNEGKIFQYLHIKNIVIVFFNDSFLHSFHVENLLEELMIFFKSEDATAF